MGQAGDFSPELPDYDLMNMRLPIGASLLLACLVTTASADEREALARPDPRTNPGSSLMLDLAATGTDPAKIDFERLAVVEGEHSIVSAGDPSWPFRLHNYLAHHNGKFWCIWSHGPEIEDQARQHVRYATSEDGLHWSTPQVLVGPPQDGYGYIARGLWIREGQLLALASLYEAPAFHDGDLELVAFAWDESAGHWQSAGRVFDNALNNFAPKKLPNGQWMMSRRASDRSVSLLIGGVHALDDWRVVPFSAYRTGGGAPEEPYWWTLPDGAIVGLFRDNSRSGCLLRSFSIDQGESWSPLVRTNFPDATSKFHGLQTSRGYWAMASNANPERRSPLCLSISPDGLVFNHLFRLPIPEKLSDATWVQNSRYESSKYESLQYPHVIEHDGALFIAFSRKKQTVEVVRVPLASIDAGL